MHPCAPTNDQSPRWPPLNSFQFIFPFSQFPVIRNFQSPPNYRERLKNKLFSLNRLEESLSLTLYLFLPLSLYEPNANQAKKITIIIKDNKGNRKILPWRRKWTNNQWRWWEIPAAKVARRKCHEYRSQRRR